MQIVLLERIAKLGQMGDVVTVRNGFARNYLLPQGKALRATKENIARFEAERTTLEAKNLERRSDAQAVHEKLDDTKFVIIRQSGDTGQLYGSVNSRDIADAVSAGGFTIERQQVSLDKPIKVLGLHPVTLRLHPEVNSNVIINVARNAEEAERQERGEDVTVSPLDAEEETIHPENVFEEGVEVKLAEDTRAADARAADARAEDARAGDTRAGDTPADDTRADDTEEKPTPDTETAHETAHETAQGEPSA